MDKTVNEVIGQINEEVEKEQVVSKGGFYISRYEVGKEGSNILVSKKGANIWNNIQQIETKSIAKTFVDNDNVKSALLSGIQWDMTMEFINRIPLRRDGLGEDDYDVTKINDNRHIAGDIAVAGKNEADKVCNIYDLEGNAYEYVAEKNTYSTEKPFIRRGGYYNKSNPASYRDNNLNGIASQNTTFRVALYVQ